MNCPQCNAETKDGFCGPCFVRRDSAFVLSLSKMTPEEVDAEGERLKGEIEKRMELVRQKKKEGLA